MVATHRMLSKEGSEFKFKRRISAWRKGADFMAKSIRCQDVGMIGCDFTATAETMEELVQAAAAHAKAAHGLDSIPPELLPLVHAAVRDE